jgi:hypothetical protein
MSSCVRSIPRLSRSHSSAVLHTRIGKYEPTTTSRLQMVSDLEVVAVGRAVSLAGLGAGAAGAAAVCVGAVAPHPLRPKTATALRPSAKQEEMIDERM